ncbi:hypothetical protein CLV33_1081 [Jejuia pallidilutea]|uniref:Uncharacterized protein n=1 Tax=Jejuia pallidilutea TaxID=504487 RepID=A0A362WYD7_9FLAO|nr:hypothetical protein [Jejuia pallidilutea]PQV46849.1 hypothetical protein CLV33_1081 [Jejuia pallidilutea]
MKKIFGFQITINDKKICRAGFENKNSVLTCILDSIRRENDESEELNISIAGLNSDTKERANWFQSKLNEKDKISIEIISDNFDSPISMRSALSEKDIITRKLKTYHKLKEELKEYLEE